MKWDDIGNWLNKVDDTVYWWLAIARGYLKALWQRVVWNIRWPFLWLGYQIRRLITVFQSMRISAAYTKEDGKCRIIIRIRWLGFVENTSL